MGATHWSCIVTLWHFGNPPYAPSLTTLKLKAWFMLLWQVYFSFSFALTITGASAHVAILHANNSHALKVPQHSYVSIKKNLKIRKTQRTKRPLFCQKQKINAGWLHAFCLSSCHCRTDLGLQVSNLFLYSDPNSLSTSKVCALQIFHYYYLWPLLYCTENVGEQKPTQCWAGGQRPVYVPNILLWLSWAV